MLLSTIIGYHYVHIFYVSGNETSVILTAEVEDSIPFYFWYLENLVKENDIKSSDKYPSLQKERNFSARKLTYEECAKLLADWKNILEFGYRCENPNLYGSDMLVFSRPLYIATGERSRILTELTSVKKLSEEMDWNKNELVLIIANGTEPQPVIVV